MQKPLTLARRDYIRSVCDLTSKSGLPAFVIADVLESVLAQIRAEIETEIKRDEAMWNKALADENRKSEVKQDGDDKRIFGSN